MSDDESSLLPAILVLLGVIILLDGVGSFFDTISATAGGISAWVMSADPVTLLVVALIIVFTYRAVTTDVT